MDRKHKLVIFGVPTPAEIENDYEKLFEKCGEGPDQMWLTGVSAKQLCQNLGVPAVDKQGNAIREEELYYLSEATGLVPA